MNNWIFNNKELLEEHIPEGSFGFTYIITCIHKDYKNWFYYGKKAITHNRKKKISKRVIKTTKTRKRIERVQRDSGWRNYYGSSKELNEIRKKIGNQWFRREILGFYPTKSKLSYAEAQLIICSNAIINDKCWNKWIAYKGYKHQIV